MANEVSSIRTSASRRQQNCVSENIYVQGDSDEMQGISAEVFLDMSALGTKRFSLQSKKEVALPTVPMCAHIDILRTCPSTKVETAL